MYATFWYSCPRCGTEWLRTFKKFILFCLNRYQLHCAKCGKRDVTPHRYDDLE